MSDSDWYYIRNWWKYQHYKNRNPPWIKLHKSIRTDPAFQSLSHAKRWQCCELWIVASDMDGRLPADPAYIARTLGLYHRQSAVDLLALLESKLLITKYDSRNDGVKSASTSQRRDRDREEKKEQVPASPSAPRPHPVPHPSSLHTQIVQAAQRMYVEKFKEKPSWNGAIFKNLQSLIKSKPDLTVVMFESHYRNLLDSPLDFDQNKSSSLVWLLTHFDEYVHPHTARRKSSVNELTGPFWEE